MSTPTYGPGIEIAGRITPEYAQVLTPEAVAFTFCWLFLMSCSNKKEEKCAFIPETSSIRIDLTFESLEDSLPTITQKSQLVGFLARHPEVRDLFFNRSAYPNDSVFINELYNRFTNPHLDTLLTETNRVFGNGGQPARQSRASR